MVTALYVVGVIVGLALLSAAGNLGNSIRELVSNGFESLCEAIRESAPTRRIPRPSRTVEATAGTQLAYVSETENGPDIRYTPALAFVERYNESYWEPLVIVDGRPQIRDMFIDRILLPGESLTDEECSGMKRRYADSRRSPEA